MTASAPARLDALGASGPYRSRNLEQVHDVTGGLVAELSLVPWLYAQRTLRALRAAAPPDPARREEMLVEAGRLFATGTVDGVDAETFHRTVAAVSGMPITAVREATQRVGDYAAKACASVQMARPAGAVTDWRDPRARHGCGVWTRRGEVFVVHAPANTPAVHSAWLDALALGYRVAIRPSRREPFTPHRLVCALRQAGFADDQVALLPTDHETADRLIAEADVAIAFGADDVVRKYQSSTLVLPQGPGRSKILLTEGVDVARHLDTLVESVAGHAGTGCINATAVFVEGDPRPVAEAIAERLGALPSLPPLDERARLPVSEVASAKRIDDYLQSKVDDAIPLLGGGTVVDELGDGSAVLRPAVFLLDRADAPQARIELGFPCVWVAPWSRADGVAPLRDTLTLTVVGGDDTLITELVEDPTISKVYVGDHATTWTRPGLPHEGYLGDFLMHSKAVIVG
ncbi:Acyl-CoA reductase [Streptoalloteichus tenebrarius]|uniref:Acyl-CoA reductase n=1 Tax=Streptoalloteichus tenebrarius (strain ATCC 17920 / DSM 40477 / JCM 4838 / CBS 697.72 / NBRC 16177 / NCIMB 11028 / NRRL B-12390 / A12253. 1 / ISP 5477) TaxID=1933 RepID=A0ABT1HLI7_STRSD|nr:aldehyde dehydrogenase family protein [Streptoalloteichus tenebrarius]MCP2256373.1 Acyl-CoA reductase [Streptoalloteichus tenebrarius]BFF04715.1 aldehyde dehydrogenase family protein [Streptoalloteichus tenebrarius]